MFDFRYHALSLVAVFFALAIGLLLGVAIGDEGLVSSAESSLRDRLQQQVRDARAQTRSVEAELERRERYESETFGALVGDRLQGRRIAVVIVGASDGETFGHVREALEPSGARLVSSQRLRVPLDVEALDAAAEGTRFAGLADDEDLLMASAERVGRQILLGGSLAAQMRRAMFSSHSGSFEGAEGVVLIRGEPPAGTAAADKQERERADAYLQALVRGLESFGTPVVGVEQSTTEPSQVGWYGARGLTSVDNVDQPAGQASLVFALAGAADGAYGIKPGADLVPEALVERG
jgi:hypothetical protein